MNSLTKFVVWSNAFYLVPIIPLALIGTMTAYLAIGACVSLTLGSAAYHAQGRNDDWGHRWDEVSMYGLLLVFALLAASITGRTNVETIFATLSVPMLLLLTAFIPIKDHILSNSFVVTGLLGLFAAIPTFMVIGPWTFAPAFTFIVALYVRESAQTNRDHGHRHGYWHLINGTLTLPSWALLLLLDSLDNL